MSFPFTTSVILLWVTFITLSPLPCGEGRSKEQKRALLEIKNSTNGFAFPDWDGKSCCEAIGITCDDTTGAITGIVLDGISWTQSSAWYPNVTLFTLFDKLESLYFGDMQIGGGLQPFCELKHLNYLTELSLTNSALEGLIPPCLGMIENLDILVLARNNLHGNVPSSIFSNQSAIIAFVVSDNLLQGTVPSSIYSNQTQIISFDVSNNQFEGVFLFSAFANASTLTSIGLSNNLEVETESSSWAPTFQLESLHLANCNLNKRSGNGFPSFISTQVLLDDIDLSYNSIEASIPCWLLFNSTLDYLYLQSNKINGSFINCIPIQDSFLQELDMSNNHISGLLPKSIVSSFPLTHIFNMSSNALEGTIPWSFGYLAELKVLDLSNNKFSGTIPKGLTIGGNQLEYLNLSNNKLHGKMLPKGSNMTWLQCLQLSNNHFEGIISPMISKSPSLAILEVQNNQLSGNISKWLYDHPSLVAVILSGNHLEGHILQRMCQMEKLQVFDISNNRISGGIPNCLNNITFWKKISPNKSYFHFFNGDKPKVGMPLRMKHMMNTYKGIPLLMVTALDLSSNQFIGNIPFELGELSHLLSMNLSNNFLTGPLPDSFKNLKEMESLDLSHNKLSGKIPSELVELTSLSTFSVAYNNLSGRIPFERQFSTFEIQCYDGNLGLCGEPLPRNCSMTNGLEDELKEQDKDEKEDTRMIDNPLLFYAFIVVSYAFGFWVFFGILVFNKNWRLAYFRCMDRYIESCLCNVS